MGCGRDLSRRETSPTLMFGIIILLISVAILAVEVFTAFYKSGYVWSNLHDYVNDFLVITPIPTTVFTLSGLPVQIYYVILLIVMAVSVICTVYPSIRPMISCIKNRDESIRNTALFEMTTMFAALYVVEMVFAFLLIMAGVDLASGVSGEDWELMFLLLDASVWEEVVSRILLIGVPMMIIMLALRYRSGDDHENRAEGDEVPWWRYLLGGFGMDRLALVFIVFSAAMFGIAHIPGWDLWKVFPTFLFGLISGYLFVKYGVHVTITIHFLTDYLLAFSWLMPNGTAIMAIPLLALAAFGIVYVWVYVKRCASYLKEEFKG